MKVLKYIKGSGQGIMLKSDSDLRVICEYEHYVTQIGIHAYGHDGRFQLIW